ncbi:MAG: lytic murein transglycosylase B [Gammaproteobacteria bacterium]|jgi:membrane-bound lytic murein transglycosylase B
MKYLLATLLLLTPALAVSASPTPEQRIADFYQQMQTEHNFTKDELDAWFKGVELNQKIIDNMNRPAEKVLTWQQYRKIFIKQDRIDQGIKFWHKHADILQQAEQEYKVPASLIVGLIGVETRYGRIMGSHDIFRSLYTFAFHYPRRAKFFTNELVSFLVLAREQGWQVGQMKGSYAGAMGYGQFMPSSYQMYAVDFDGDGKIQLVDNVQDAIGSVANYIKRHRWQPDGPTVMPVTVASKQADELLTKGIRPNRTLDELAAAGVNIPEGFAGDTKVTFFKLDQGEQQYWIGFQNFYVVSRYNPRVFYTKAVLELADNINSSYQASMTTSQ